MPGSMVGAWLRNFLVDELMEVAEQLGYGTCLVLSKVLH